MAALGGALFGSAVMYNVSFLCCTQTSFPGTYSESGPSPNSGPTAITTRINEHTSFPTAMAASRIFGLLGYAGETNGARARRQRAGTDSRMAICDKAHVIGVSGTPKPPP